jgi:hypothetical protein
MGLNKMPKKHIVYVVIGENIANKQIVEVFDNEDIACEYIVKSKATKIKYMEMFKREIKKG